MGGYVYFVAYDNAEWRAALPVVKIGSTYDLNNRISQLSVGSPVKLVYAGTIETLDPIKLERSLHVKFGYARMSGEWFDVSAGNMRRDMKLLNIKDSRIDELFDDRAYHPTMTQVDYGKSLGSLITELYKKDDLIKKLSRRLAEIDPQAYKILPKISCKSSSRR